MPTSARILVVDDEPSLREMLNIALRRAGNTVVVEAGVKAAAARLRTEAEPFAVVVTDLLMPDGTGLDVLRAAKERSPTTEVIVMTAHSAIDSAIDAMKAGACDFIIKPFSPAHMVAQVAKALEKHALHHENDRLRRQLGRLQPNELDFGTSPAMAAVADLVSRIAKAKTTVLITGESGTGKERIARIIHARSDRRDGPFRVVNCGALPEALMESELFGHEKGAFTGATSSRPGIVREADGGVLLLDEVGELPLSLQVKLLRVLQEKRVRPVGGVEEIPVDVRILAATNRDIEADVKKGSFRQDLYYRLNVIRLQLPPLRERASDIRVLAEQFLRRFSEEQGKELRALSAEALRALEAYAFPGNVRELENVVERAVALAGATTVGLGDLPPEVAGAKGLPLAGMATLGDGSIVLDDVLAEVERRLLVEALAKTGGVRSQAAKLLGVTFRSIRYRLEKHGIEVGDSGEDDNGQDSSPSSSRG
jgi:two-component system response regulator PilR (NtrC family)